MSDEITIKSQNGSSGANSSASASKGGTTVQSSSSSQGVVTNQATNPDNLTFSANQKVKRGYDLNADVEQATEQQKKPQKFAIPKMVWDNYPDIVDLITKTESMDDEEREYWFQVLPIMTDHQIQKFKTILLTEKAQLEELDKEYEQELQKLNEKHMIEWKEFETKEKRNALKAEEKKASQEESSVEEELLSKLSQI